MSNSTDERACARCGAPVPTTVTAADTAEQLAVDRVVCPSCGAELVRGVEGHADRGWQLAETET